MQFARHIPLRRSDRKSQMETFREAVASLQAGNSLVAFPEGTRSKARPLPLALNLNLNLNLNLAFLTLLMPGEEGGLECLLPNGELLPVSRRKGAFVVNLGEALQQMR